MKVTIGPFGRCGMLVIVTKTQLISPQQVCQNCLLADCRGQPRWQGGHLGCGDLVCPSSGQQPEQYLCQMGFRIARIADYTQSEPCLD